MTSQLHLGYISSLFLPTIINIQKAAWTFKQLCVMHDFDPENRQNHFASNKWSEETSRLNTHARAVIVLRRNILFPTSTPISVRNYKQRLLFQVLTTRSVKFFYTISFILLLFLFLMVLSLGRSEASWKTFLEPRDFFVKVPGHGQWRCKCCHLSETWGILM